ncbi:DUF6164 family protein [Halomonas sp. NCCP-2165]|nr:DUF6164 family protein [Halomonas sp. NCCP-2165]GKW49032.1 hypothetical protein NCCP2165_12470 [Halomonas sp. NCCP-2165]
MAVLLFKLRGVPEDEADEVRERLATQGFETYETQEGFWRLGEPAIWLRDPEQFAAARRVIEAYQAERAALLHREREARRARGEADTLGRRLVHQPLRLLLLLAGAGAILALSLLPFLRLG